MNNNDYPTATLLKWCDFNKAKIIKKVNIIGHIRFEVITKKWWQ